MGDTKIRKGDTIQIKMADLDGIWNAEYSMQIADILQKFLRRFQIFAVFESFKNEY